MGKIVSIVIPCYNHAEYISETLDSALNQTYENLEIICVNDCSQDNSAEIIKEYAEKYSNIIFLDLKENVGVVNSKNLAIEHASGEYILPLDSDDKIADTYIEKAVQILDNNPDIGIVYCKANLFGLKDEYWDLPEYKIENFLFENCIFCSALFRKSDFLKAGKYKEYMKYGIEDWDLWLSFVELGLSPYRIDEILFYYRQHSDSSRNKIYAQKADEMLNELHINHPRLYFNLLIEKEKIKAKKYKRISKIFVAVSFIQFLLIMLIVIFVKIG